MKHLLSFLLCCAFGALFVASSTQRNVIVEPAKQTFTFDYKTKAPTASGSAGITVCLIRSRYADELAFFNNTDIFADFHKSFEADIEELFTDKGFHIRGPYQAYDEAVFEDKKESDIGIEIVIEPHFAAADGGWRSYRPLSFSSTPVTYYYYEGTVSLTGKIKMTGYEPLSHEKIWVKSVEIPSVTGINVSTASRTFDRPLPGNSLAFLNDVNVYNALGTALQAQYQAILAKVDAYLDPREFTSLRQQIKELKSKKGY